MFAPSRQPWTPALLALACASLPNCGGTYETKGERLAHTYCAVCHMFPDPQLLDKNTWATGVLPQMAQRLGLPAKSLYEEVSRNPQMTVLTKPVSEADWKEIVGFYVEHAPAALPEQSLPAQPQLDP